MGKKRFITKNSFMLIHQPQIFWAGKHDEFIDEIENQKNIFETVKNIYLETTKMKEEELEDLLRHELWLTSSRCLELGLVDAIE
jgi:ATP-dependent protease ClpP protease subunit